jgi:hypothetical protein
MASEILQTIAGCQFLKFMSAFDPPMAGIRLRRVAGFAM